MGAPITDRLKNERNKKGENMLISIVFIRWTMIDDKREG